MKIAYTSDLHHEFGTQQDITLNEPVDVLVLAGDIDAGKRLVERALHIGNSNASHIVFICGNHEFYGSRVDKVYRRIEEDLEAHRQKAAMHPELPFVQLHFLQNSFVDIDGVRFAGDTCWTDYELDGNPDIAMFDAGQYMNDYRRIKYFDTVRSVYRKLIPSDVLRMNLYAKQFIFDQIYLAQEEDRADRLVIVTHHGPTHMSIDPEFAGNQLNPAYANNWGRKIAYEGGPALWFHGHVHCDRHYECGDTLVLCNPWGYPGQREAPKIKVIEL